MLSSAQKVLVSSMDVSPADTRRQSAGHRRAMGALRAVLMLGVVLLSAFTAGRIFLAGVPLGGVRDLLTLYGATAALALSLALLWQLKSPTSKRPGGSVLQPAAQAPSDDASGVFALGLRDESWKSVSPSSIAVANGRP